MSTRAAGSFVSAQATPSLARTDDPLLQLGIRLAIDAKERQPQRLVTVTTGQFPRVLVMVGMKGPLEDAWHH
jgi:hypothetical protein